MLRAVVYTSLECSPGTKRVIISNKPSSAGTPLVAYQVGCNRRFLVPFPPPKPLDPLLGAGHVYTHVWRPKRNDERERSYQALQKSAQQLYEQWHRAARVWVQILTLFTGNHSNQDPRYAQKPTYYAILANQIWS